MVTTCLHKGIEFACMAGHNGKYHVIQLLKIFGCSFDDIVLVAYNYVADDDDIIACCEKRIRS